MIARLNSFGLSGIIGFSVDVEVNVSGGTASVDIVGLPDAAVKESKERVRAAIANSGFSFPNAKVMVNLAPADFKKEGSLYDLGVALCILCATGQMQSSALENSLFLGELSLNGEVRHVNGILPLLISAYQSNVSGHTSFKRVFVPTSNANEAAYIRGMEIYPVKSLREIASFFNGSHVIEPVCRKEISEEISCRKYSADFKYVMGQYRAKRALEIAATGGHNVLMIGPPGAGKTMLARCIPTIMPDMTADECLESTKIYSVAGALDPNEGIVATRPFRTPHHTASRIALTGGGVKAKPGEISLAHNGVLFMDELPEYNRSTLEILRQPLEDGVITISRAMRTVEYPARFMLIASMNPCPCGNYGSEELVCTCSPTMVNKYLSKISGPLMDRIDIHLEVDSIQYDELRQTDFAESSDDIKKRVNAARHIQEQRFLEFGYFCNSYMTPHEVNLFCKLDSQSEKLLKAAFERLKLSARAHNRILKVARTIADLEGSEDIQSQHIMEAIGYRSLDGKYNKL